MTLDEIKKAIEDGKYVFWKNKGYQVIKDVIKREEGDIIQYLVHCRMNNNYWGLTKVDKVTLNGEESDFFTIED